MKLENKNFPIYMNTAMMNIAPEDIDDLLMELCANAMFYMNTENTVDTNIKLVAGVKDLILSDRNYRHLPLHLIIESFHKGSTGELGGTSKFGLRNVNIWLFQSKEKHQKIIADDKSREIDRQRAESEQLFKRNNSKDWIFGRAFLIKLDWNYHGAINSSDWDKYTLNSIVDLLRQGYDEHTITPKMILK